MSRYLLPLALLLLGGCAASTPQAFYQLPTPAAQLPANAAGPAVLLGPLQLADYLQRENLMQRQSDQRLSVSASGRWAGSLQDDIGNLLLATLATHLHSSDLALYPDRIGFSAQAQIILNISRLDSGPQLPAVLEAQWRLLDRNGQLRDSRLLRLEEAHSGTVADQVQAQSRLLRQLTQQLAAAIEPLRDQPIAEASKPAQTPKRPARAPQQPGPKIPMVGPTPGGGEVLRF